MTYVTTKSDGRHNSPSPRLLSRTVWLLALEEPGDTFSENVRRREQANYEKVAGTKIIEMARMNEDMACPQELDRKVFI